MRDMGRLAAGAPRAAVTSIRDGESVAAAGCNRNRFPCDGDRGVTADTSECLLQTLRWRTRLMLKQQSSSNVNRVVRPFKRRIGELPRGLDLSDDGRSGRYARLVQADALTEDASRSVESPAEADGAPGWGAAALAFVMEGFALYGAALHPNAAFSIEEAATTAIARPPRPTGRPPHAVTHEQGGLQRSTISNVVEPELAAWAASRPQRRWSWWAALGETVGVLLTHWRREREIKRAIAALAKYDDRTLRDLGINGWADIERVVRYCRDC